MCNFQPQFSNSVWGRQSFISRALHVLNPLFLCALYCRTVYNAGQLIFHKSFLDAKVLAKMEKTTQLFSCTYYYQNQILRTLLGATNKLILLVPTLMQFYDSRPPVLWSKWPLASSLLHAIKTCRQACPPGYLMHSL